MLQLGRDGIQRTKKKQRDNGQPKDNGKVVDKDQKRGGEKAKRQRERLRSKEVEGRYVETKTCWLGERSEIHQNRVQ